MHCVMQGLFKVKPWYFVALFAHIVLLDVAAWFTLRYFGNSWGSWLATAVMLTTSQASCTRTVTYVLPSYSLPLAVRNSDKAS